MKNFLKGRGLLARRALLLLTLEVSVDNVVAVAMVERKEQLQHDTLDLCDREPLRYQTQRGAAGGKQPDTKLSHVHASPHTRG